MDSTKRFIVSTLTDGKCAKQNITQRYAQRKKQDLELRNEEDHQRSQWLLGTGFLTNVKMSSGFFVILFWLLGQKASKKPL